MNKAQLKAKLGKNHKKRNKNLKSGYVDKRKPTAKQNKKVKLKNRVKPSLKDPKDAPFNKKAAKSVEINIDGEIPRRKTITHQTLFLKKDKRKKQNADVGTNPAYDFNIGKSNKNLSLRERMLHKLKAARFRYLNEEMYTNIGKDAKRYFENDPNAYTAYHEGYQQQVTKWPLNPVDVIIRKVNKLPEDYVIADFGCGEAKLAKSTSHTVHCFDLVAVDERVTACDMAHVPLKDNSVNVVVFCLSLMGTNLKDYILEARRVLKNKGSLFIAEVESRFDDVDVFIKNLRSYGFVNTRKDFSHNLFFFLDFVKDNTKMSKKILDINLNPCLYKKR